MIGADGQLLDPLWCAEFRGFFYGEGYIGITRNGIKGTAVMYSARAQITLRDDDLAMLQDIKEKLGGNLFFERRVRLTKVGDRDTFSRPYAAWRTRSLTNLRLVIAVLEGGIMPSKKRQDLKIVKQFLATIGSGRSNGSTAASRSAFRIAAETRAHLHDEILTLHRPRGAE